MSLLRVGPFDHQFHSDLSPIQKTASQFRDRDCHINTAWQSIEISISSQILVQLYPLTHIQKLAQTPEKRPKYYSLRGDNRSAWRDRTRSMADFGRIAEGRENCKPISHELIPSSLVSRTIVSPRCSRDWWIDNFLIDLSCNTLHSSQYPHGYCGPSSSTMESYVVILDNYRQMLNLQDYISGIGKSLGHFNWKLPQLFWSIWMLERAGSISLCFEWGIAKPPLIGFWNPFSSQDQFLKEICCHHFSRGLDVF
jgi:hypothetical protein